MIKYLLIFLLFINSVFSYKFNIIKNISLRNNNNLISRRKLFTLSPLVITFLAYDKNDNDKSIQELRQEANRIIEIIEAQKEAFELPKLNDKSNIDNTKTNDKKIVNNDIEKILKDILYTFKNNDPNFALTKLKSYSSDMNTIKQTSNERLIALFSDSKYGILFNKFKDYEIINYETYNDETEEFCNVDVKIYAKYKDLLYNGVQFNDIYYPDNIDLNDNENICYIIYKWNFIKKNKTYELVSCYLEPRV